MGRLRLAGVRRRARAQSSGRVLRLALRAAQLKMVPKNWMNGIRVSTHLFNTEHDVDVLVSALGTELA